MADSARDPYAPPEADLEGRGRARTYPGLGRAPYFALSVGLGIPTMLIDPHPGSEYEEILSFILIMLSVALIAATVQRLRNTGLSGWWVLLGLIPIANLYITVRCLLYPTGYSPDGRLDTPAKVGLWMIGGFVVLIVVVVVVPVLLGR